MKMNPPKSVLKPVLFFQNKLGIVSCTKASNIMLMMSLLNTNQGKYSISRLARDLGIRVESVYRYCREYDTYFEVNEGTVWLRLLKLAA